MVRLYRSARRPIIWADAGAAKAMIEAVSSTTAEVRRPWGNKRPRHHLQNARAIMRFCLANKAALGRARGVTAADVDIWLSCVWRAAFGEPGDSGGRRGHPADHGPICEKRMGARQNQHQRCRNPGGSQGGEHQGNLGRDKPSILVRSWMVTLHRRQTQRGWRGLRKARERWKHEGRRLTPILGWQAAEPTIKR